MTFSSGPAADHGVTRETSCLTCLPVPTWASSATRPRICCTPPSAATPPQWRGSVRSLTRSRWLPPSSGYPGEKETPLITAASYGDAEVAKVLIEAGADIEAVSAPDSGGIPSSTALTHAAIFGMTEVVDVLVAAGARITSFGNAVAARDITGWPLGRFTPQSKIRALISSATHQRLNVIDQLIAAGTPVNEPDAERGELPLHAAAQNGRPASVRRLLARGADPDLRDPVHQRTPLEWCQPEYRDPESPAHDEADAILRPVTGRGRPVSPGAGQEPSGIQVRIEASGLPDRSWRPESGSRPRNLHVGVQHRKNHGELLCPCLADAATAAWTFPAMTIPTPAGMDLNGP